MEKEEMINQDDTYDIIKEKLLKYDNGKYKDFILEKEHFDFIYRFPIFDVENKDKNKTLDAIALCKNLHTDYYATAKWLGENTHYFPGLLNIDLRLFIVVRKLRLCVMLTPNREFDVPFTFEENKEDGELLAITLKYSRDKFGIGNIAKAVNYYFSLDKLRKNLVKANDKFLKNLDKASTIEFKY